MPKVLPINNKKCNIRVFKVITGEDIIGYMFPEDEKRNAIPSCKNDVFLIGAPKIIESKVEYGSTDIIMTCRDWIPYAENPVALVSQDKIVSIFKPNQQYLNFYLNSYWDAQYYVSDIYHQKSFLELYLFDQDDTYQ